jgi:hypothetical protein
MTRTADTEQLSTTLVGAFYCVAILLPCLSAFDYLVTIWPMQPSEPRWRFGAMGLLSGFILTPLLGAALAIVVANSRRHFAALRAIGVVCLVLAAILCVAWAGFGLDAIELRKGAVPDARRGGDLGAVKAILKLGAAIGAAAWLGVGALRQGRVPAEPLEEPPTIVVGR